MCNHKFCYIVNKQIDKRFIKEIKKRQGKNKIHSYNTIPLKMPRVAGASTNLIDVKCLSFRKLIALHYFLVFVIDQV